MSDICLSCTFSCNADVLWDRSLPNLLRATLKQAILYSPIPANPLQFILPPSPVLDGEALMRAAEGISASVVASGKLWIFCLFYPTGCLPS